MNDRGIHHGAALEQQALLFQGVVNGVHDRRGQLVLLQQPTELQDRRFVRHRFVEQVQPSKRPHARYVVQRVFHAGIGEVDEPLLHEVDAQHGLQPPRPATLARLRIVRFDQRHQRRPRHHRFHLFQKALALRLPFLHAFSQRGKEDLLHAYQ